MHIFYSILTLTSLFFAGCTGQTKSLPKPIEFVDTLKTFKREIPIMNNGRPDLFYVLAKDKQNQLGLDSLENGFRNLQIRIWYDFARVLERKLLILENKGTEWTATVYNMQVNYNGESETIISKEVKQVMPKSGWAKFSKKLLDLQIVTLPDMHNISSLVDNWKDGEGYNVEVASKMQYRFYGYHMPYEFQEFWQARNFSEILNLFEAELGVARSTAHNRQL